MLWAAGFIVQQRGCQCRVLPPSEQLYVADQPGLSWVVLLFTAQGMEVVQAIAQLPRVKDNTNSPFFQAGKAAGGCSAGSVEPHHGIRSGNLCDTGTGFSSSCSRARLRFYLFWLMPSFCLWRRGQAGGRGAAGVQQALLQDKGGGVRPAVSTVSVRAGEVGIPAVCNSAAISAGVDHI
jgi:hypothetical protein